MPYDPTLYRGAAAHYARGRPPYSRDLAPALARELGLDGSGRLLDVGCGPGILTVELADRFAEAIGVDPDPDMLAVAARRASRAGVRNVRWVQAVAEDLERLDLGRFELVTFGQSFHWTDRERVAEMVYDLLVPGGALALVGHAWEGRPRPEGPGPPLIPHDAMHELIRRYLGSRKRAGQGFLSLSPERHEEVLARTRFGAPREILLPGRADLVLDADGVLAGFLSTSFAAPHLFGDRLAAFEAEARDLLERYSPTHRFWDWPGDTGILLARKPQRDR
jgi:SAM-dependent methyltransferase